MGKDQYIDIFKAELKNKIQKALDFIETTLSLNQFSIYLLGEDDLLIPFVESRGSTTFLQGDLLSLERLEGYIVRRIEAHAELTMLLLYGESKKSLGSLQSSNIEQSMVYLASIIEQELAQYEREEAEYNQLRMMELYKALNRQFNKEKAIKILVEFIKKKFGYEAAYFGISEEREIVALEYVSEQEKIHIDHSVFAFHLPVKDYKRRLYFEDAFKMKEKFPAFHRIFCPKVLLSTPVYSQDKLAGLLIVYSKERSSIEVPVQGFIQSVSRELTALFTRIERHNLSLEKMLHLTALENILLYNVDEEINFNEVIQQFVAAIPEATGMQKCTIALVDDGGEYLLPHYSTIYSYDDFRKIKYPLDKRHTQDHTAIIALETKKPVIVYDATLDPRCDPKLAKELGILSNITLPILDIHGKGIGVVYLDNGKHELFSKKQIRFLEIIARHLGLILSNIHYIGDLHIRSKYDGLTGLFNRQTFESIYEVLYRDVQLEDGKFSLLMIDMDNFKEINDTYGHPIGDKILKKVAKTIESNLRKQDIVARYGGEEMIVLLRDTGREGALRIGERIRTSVEELSMKGIRVTASIGVATYKTDSEDKNKLIQIADENMYVVKNSGKNQVGYRKYANA